NRFRLRKARRVRGETTPTCPSQSTRDVPGDGTVATDIGAGARRTIRTRLLQQRPERTATIDQTDKRRECQRDWTLARRHMLSLLGLARRGARGSCVRSWKGLTNQANRRDEGRAEGPPRSVRVERVVRPHAASHLRNGTNV